MDIIVIGGPNGAGKTTAAIYDSSDGGRQLIAERDMGFPLVVRDAARWAAIEGMTT